MPMLQVSYVNQAWVEYEMRLTLFAQLHVSCMTPYSLCRLTPPLRKGHSMSRTSSLSVLRNISMAAFPVVSVWVNWLWNFNYR